MLSIEDTRIIAARTRSSWKQLVAADLLYKLFSVALLTPLLTVAIQSLLVVRGEAILADVDILAFLAGPYGWTFASVAGTLWLTVVAMEQSTLIAILAAGHCQKPITVVDAVRFSLNRIVHVLKVTGQLLLRSYLVAIPFLLAGFITYQILLGEYDINYYLYYWPTEFYLALAIGFLLLATLSAILFVAWAGWFLSLPIMLFERQFTPDPIQKSRRIVKTHWSLTLRWLGAWLAAAVLAHFLLSTIVGWTSELLIPEQIRSLAFLATRVGVLFIIAAVAGYTVNAISTILLAGLLFHTYLDLVPESDSRILSSLPDQSRSSASAWKLSTIRLGVILVIASLITLLVGLDTLNDLQLKDDIQIMAHRGASLAAPENTLAAMRQAINDKADWLK